MVSVLDTRWRGHPGIIAVFAVPHREGVALVESGPESAFAEVEKGLRELGYEPRDVTDVLLTHIHLDHAGAAWRFAEAGARVHVHPRGARHLADPSRLLASAERIYGDRMRELWGELRPVPSDRLHAVADGEVVNVGGLAFTALETPGHAVHHHVWELEGLAFTGDVAGVRIAGGPALPPCPPPDIQVEDWLASVERLQRLEPEGLYLTHYGLYRDWREHLEDLVGFLTRWSDWVGERLKAGAEPGRIAAEFRERLSAELAERGVGSEAARAYELANPADYTVAGLIRYWQKHRGEELRAG